MNSISKKAEYQLRLRIASVMAASNQEWSYRLETQILNQLSKKSTITDEMIVDLLRTIS